jgi:hypothetical protein
LLDRFASSREEQAISQNLPKSGGYLEGDFSYKSTATRGHRYPELDVYGNEHAPSGSLLILEYGAGRNIMSGYQPADNDPADIGSRDGTGRVNKTCTVYDARITIFGTLVHAG